MSKSADAVDPKQVAVLNLTLSDNSKGGEVNLRISYLLTDKNTEINVAALGSFASEFYVHEFLQYLDETEKKLKLKRQDTTDIDNPAKVVAAFIRSDGQYTTYEHSTNGKPYNFLGKASSYAIQKGKQKIHHAYKGTNKDPDSVLGLDLAIFSSQYALYQNQLDLLQTEIGVTTQAFDPVAVAKAITNAKKLAPNF